jgi:hypothetical protein
VIRVKWSFNNNPNVYIGTVIGVVNDDEDIVAVVADDEGPIIKIALNRLINASASAIPVIPPPGRSH